LKNPFVDIGVFVAKEEEERKKKEERKKNNVTTETSDIPKHLC
jgi:hypothetical protein